MLSLKHFHGNNYLVSGNQEEQDVLYLLNQKVAENPNYPVPDGYKKVTEIVIEDAYHVPDELGMKDSEKISLELIDNLIASTFNGLHVLRSVPVTRTITKVTLDENKIFLNMASASRNLRSNSQSS